MKLSSAFADARAVKFMAPVRLVRSPQVALLQRLHQLQLRVFLNGPLVSLNLIQLDSKFCGDFSTLESSGGHSVGAPHGRDGVYARRALESSTGRSSKATEQLLISSRRHKMTQSSGFFACRRHRALDARRCSAVELNCGQILAGIKQRGKSL